MPGSGTDKTKRWLETPGPCVVLVEPQMGENIGAAARAMANFGLSRLRLVSPKQGWPNEKARVMAAGADRVLDNAAVVATLPDAIADCTYVLATTARQHDQAKPVISAAEAGEELARRVAAGESCAILFGRERNGLEADEVGRADAIVTLPVNPAFASLNLAQAVIIVAYEWFKASQGGGTPFTQPEKSPPASKQQFDAFFTALEDELERVEFYRPREKRATMSTNLRNMFNRMTPSAQDVRTLHGIVMALAEGRKGPARGGTLEGNQAEALRGLLAGEGASKDAPARGLAKLLRRNPTEAERRVWQALTNDKRFAGRGFRRQTPVGPHVVDFVSFPLRCVIELEPADQNEAHAQARADRRAWLEAHDYRVLMVTVAAIEADSARVLDRLAEMLPSPSAP
ncbi:MAG: TrmJ/YjtD family RNA methyltransferase [Pseudolabrys sp.]|nr:TrmJ/YjtD family RNA methyltransferase [Pseudolabrys sp.]